MSEQHMYTHEAMKTTFALRLVSTDATLCKQVASACIARIDEIEARLSRYVQGSDVWQINHLKSDDSIFISEDCHACLLLALEAHQATGGLFDITLGKQIEHRKQSMSGPRPELSGQIMIDPDRPAVHCITQGREIDLGGIGKGFALDQITRICREWNIPSGLLSAGASTQIAFGQKSWDITLQGNHSSEVIQIKDQALSASGTAIQGSHIISPFDSQPSARSHVWVISASAALADALSTAAILAGNVAQIMNNGESPKVYIENKNGMICLYE